MTCASCPTGPCRCCDWMALFTGRRYHEGELQSCPVPRAPAGRNLATSSLPHREPCHEVAIASGRLVSGPVGADVRRTAGGGQARPGRRRVLREEGPARPRRALLQVPLPGRQKPAKGGLRLDSRAALLKGGDSGPALVPGQPDKSRLIEAIAYKNVDLQMPPRGKLPDAAIADLTAWVKMGAPWPRRRRRRRPRPARTTSTCTSASASTGPGSRSGRSAAGRQGRGLAARPGRSLHPGEAGGEGPAARPPPPTGARCSAASPST